MPPQGSDQSRSMKQGDTPSLLDDFDFDAFINLPLDEVDMGLGALHHIILPITMEPSCTIPAVTSQIRRNHMTLGPQQAPGIAPKEPKKPAKARFSCSHQGCKRNFPRTYELSRHVKSIHQRNNNLLCPIYGCPRSEKTFPRSDKLRQHFREKHSDPEHFLCFIENCTAGPFTKEEISSHFEENGDQSSHNQPNSGEILNAIRWRFVPLENGHLRLESLDACPLAFLGCYTIMPSDISKKKNFRAIIDHLGDHPQEQRLPKFGNICRYFWKYNWRSYVWCRCRVCNSNIPSPDIENYFIHLYTKHSSEERRNRRLYLIDDMRSYQMEGELVPSWLIDDCVAMAKNKGNEMSEMSSRKTEGPGLENNQTEDGTVTNTSTEVETVAGI